MYFFANWKMYLKEIEALSLAKVFKSELKLEKKLTAVVFPSALHFGRVAESLKGSAIGLGAQDVGPEAYGAATGENSPQEVKSLAGRYALIGHSERRHLMGESEEMVARKLHAALAAHLTPVLCVGERSEERRNGQAKEVVRRQLTSALEKQRVSNLVVAYEPVWAIGSGHPATPAEAREMHEFIRGELLKFLENDGARVPILYGGSVEAAGLLDFLRVPEVEGVLVGGASTKSESLKSLLQICKSVSL
ncbi:MAG: triose-phosphate isomerase [bacterium]